MRPDELLPVDSVEAYAEIAGMFHFDCLGVLGQTADEKPEQVMADFRQDPGTLADERWKSLPWCPPEK